MKNRSFLLITNMSTIRFLCIARSFLAIASLVALGSCGFLPKKSDNPDTVVQLVITASPSINPDINGRPSPVVVRIYQLKAQTAFSIADYFTLTEREQEALGSDLLFRESFVIRPGETRKWEHTYNAMGGRGLGIVVGYRAIERSTWRAFVEVPDEGSPLWNSLLSLVRWGDPTIEYSAKLDERSVTLAPSVER